MKNKGQQKTPIAAYFVIALIIAFVFFMFYIMDTPLSKENRSYDKICREDNAGRYIKDIKNADGTITISCGKKFSKKITKIQVQWT